MSAPDVTVVVPTFRRPDALPRIVAALEAQTLAADRFEVVIVDDGSGDGTPDVLARLAEQSRIAIRPVVLPANSGAAAARNAGWQTARSRFIAFTDDDCEPEPEWLEWGLKALESDPQAGVVQGRTLKPRGELPRSRWTTYREVVAPSPWFEGCNLFYRREALERAGGFDERLSFGGEDTALGWAVLAEGWTRLFEQAAVVRHDLSERGVRWHVAQAWQEGRLLDIAARYPALRQRFWRPWAVRPWNVAFAAGVASTLLATRKPVALAGWLPWIWLRKPPRGFHPWFRYLGEKWAVDAATFAGMKVAAVRNRMFVL